MVSKRANYSAIIKILGTIVLITGIAMMIPLLYALVMGDRSGVAGFKLCAPITLICGLVISLIFHSDRSKFGVRDGYLIVTMCWALSSLIGAFPYYLSGSVESFLDAVFESTSGFTTTGATILNIGLESPSLILWRSLSHWLGGMGILVFVISILPALGISGQFIVRAEAPGPVYQKTTTRISNSARMLYVTYFSFTLAEFILLMLSGKMSVYEALVMTLGCVSTGGLCPHPGGVAAYDSFYIELILAIFCILASINFILYHYLVTGHLGQALKDIELRAYLLIICFATILSAINLITNSDCDLPMALREGFFASASMASTAGYTRSASMIWPATCQLILITLSLIGGCSASTAGSIKVVRILVMFRLIARNCIRRIHPRSVVAVKLGGNAVSAPVVSNITAFLLTFGGVLLLSGLVLSLQGYDIETNLTTAIAMLSNTGLAIDHCSPVSCFSFYSAPLKIYLCLLMIAGRLELFTVIILFTRNFWGKNR